MTNRRGKQAATEVVSEKEEVKTMTTEPQTEMASGDIRVNLDTKTTFPISIPAGLLVKISDVAKEQDMTAVEFARQTLAKAVSYDRPLGTGRRAAKYGSDEEKKAAQALRNKARRDLVNSLLKQYMAADDDDDEDEDEDEK